MTDIQQLRQKLVDICKQFVLASDINVVIREAYIPYIPENWNGYLVLAEAQNMSEGQYSGASEDEIVGRLYPKDNNKIEYANDCTFPELDIKPWEDGSIPLALKAALDLNPFETAVCNGCLWSAREKGRNINPTDRMKEESTRLWREILPLLEGRLKKVICCGSVAQSIISEDVLSLANKDADDKISLRLPSPNAMSRVSGMFTEADLFKRYPEVEQAFNALKLGESNVPKIKNYRQNKIFYACHAVSVCGKLAEGFKQG